ncbi:MAG: sugar transferase [Planctomycetes bacterium]|nr:sugar transferase [Planctomycetota bacterium]
MQTTSPAGAAGELADLVERYVAPEDLPSPEWLTRHHLAAPIPSLKALDRRTRFLKRAFDVTVSGLLLVLLAPLLAAIAVLIRATSRGPAVFRQIRIGLNQRGSSHDRRRAPRASPPGSDRRSGSERRRRRSWGRPFVLYKFRTMHADAEKDGARFTVKGDPRITPVGRVLRRTRLDELPQLWNVLRGEMSLVGPRPERPEFVSELSREIPGYLHRLRLKPGLTGLAQVLNGYDNDLESFRRKVALDLLYLQNCSFWNDVKILARTVGVVITGRGAL